MQFNKKIILASASPRRKQLLEQAGLTFETIVTNASEDFPADMEAKDIPIYIAQNKARSVPPHYLQKDNIIITADTIVVINNTILGKPVHAEEAMNMLQTLSGKMHRVITGVAIIHHEQFISFAETTEVYFKNLAQEQIQYYVDHYQPYDKAGAYAIQEWIGLTGIEKISGCYYNVMGLPVSRLLEILQQFHQS